MGLQRSGAGYTQSEAAFAASSEDVEGSDRRVHVSTRKQEARPI